MGEHTSIYPMAKICHEANRAYCESIGDFTQPSWGEASGWQIISASDGVRFHLEHPDATDADAHDYWIADKRAQGWVWGPVKDTVAKTSPQIVAFEKLPLEQQVGNRLFRAIVHAISPVFIQSS